MPDNNLFGVDFIARCIAGEGLETANKRQWKLQAGPRILLSDNPETQTTTISATGDDITVDDALSTTSENPVQNKVITNELLTKPTCVLPNGTKVNNQNIMQLTRAQYDAIQNKDPNTYYMVTGDSEAAVFYRTAYVDMTNDYTRTIDSDGALLVTFEVPDDFSMLEARICYTVNWTCGSWTNTDSSLTSILTITPNNDAPARDGRKTYMGVITDQYIGEAPNQTHVNVNTAQLLGANYITYDETNHTVTIKVTKPVYAYDYLTGDEVDNTSLTVNSYTVDELGYIAFGSDNINITSDSYTAGTGISIDNNHAISIAANYAANIEATMDPNTYVITLRLKDQNGVYLGTAQTIDLPLESVVVSGAYDDTTKKIILTLENGQTVEFSVADLVSGLETSAHAASTYLTQNDAANTYATQLTVSGLKTVPAVTSSDDGKILTADYTGGVASYSWQTAPSGGTSDYEQLTNKPAIDGTTLSASSTASGLGLATSTDIADMATQTWVGQQDFLDSNDVATVATTGDYDDLINKPTIPAAQVNADWSASTGVSAILNKPTLGTAAAANTSDFATAAQGAKADTAVQPADISDMATETWVGQQGFLTDADEVPAVTSNDDGKVLTATYSGGTGSYAWATPSGGSGLQVETDGTNYWITVNGIRLYFASSAPTGTIPTGSYGIGWS